MTRHDTAVTGEWRERHERQDELRRIHVSLLILEDRVVDAGYGESPSGRLGRRQIREADVPGEQALCAP